MKRPRTKGFGEGLTREELVGLLHYDEETGLFKWRNYQPGMRKDGIAGTVSRYGYCQIVIRDHFHFAHRLAWLYVHGVWPSKVLDHIDGDRLNNRIANLRDVSQRENLVNGYRSRPLGWTWRQWPAYNF